jgi:hypothetical protein
MDALKDGRKNNFSHILPQMRLEGRVALLVVAQLLEELLDRLSESLVLRIFIELLSEKLDLVQDTIGMGSVFISKQIVALIVESIPLIGCSILHDVALLLKSFADVCVKLLEPSLEFRVLVGIAVNLVEGIEEIVGAGSVCEAFNKRLKVGQRWLAFSVKF